VEAVVVASVPTVSRVSQTPLYDQLRRERLKADVPVSDIDVSALPARREPLPFSGLRAIPAEPDAVAVRGVSSGPDVDLGVDCEWFSRRGRHEEGPRPAR